MLCGLQRLPHPCRLAGGAEWEGAGAEADDALSNACRSAWGGGDVVEIVACRMHGRSFCMKGREKR